MGGKEEKSKEEVRDTSNMIPLSNCNDLCNTRISSHMS